VRHDKLTQIDGANAAADRNPAGLRFNPRCTERGERCLVERPDLMSAGTSRAAAGCISRRPSGAPLAKERLRWPDAVLPTGDAASSSVIAGLKRYFDVSAPGWCASSRAGHAQIVQAVDGIDIEIARARPSPWWAKSGCGKSTVARLVSGSNADRGLDRVRRQRIWRHDTAGATWRRCAGACR